MYLMLKQYKIISFTAWDAGGQFSICSYMLIWFAFYSMLFSFQCMFCLGTLLGELFLWTCSQKLVVWNLAWEPVPRDLAWELWQCGFGLLRFAPKPLQSYGWRPQAYAVGEKIESTLTASGNHNSNTNCPPRRTLTKTAKVCKKITSEGFGERMVIVIGI